MMDPGELRQRARHFRQLASLIPDDQAFAAAIGLAREYEQQADAAARREGAAGKQRLGGCVEPH